MFRAVTKSNNATILSKVRNRIYANVSQKQLTKEKSQHQQQIKSDHIYVMKNKLSVDPGVTITLSKHKSTYKKSVVVYDEKRIYRPKDIKKWTLARLRQIFLPRDYPNSVQDGYYNFSKFAAMSGICCHIMTFLSTQVLINSLGYNSSKLTLITLSAGLNWVLKDSLGQIGGIFFSSKFSSSIECNLKKWRTLSIYLFNIGIILEISTLVFPQKFLMLATAASVCKTNFNFLGRVCAFNSSSATRTGIYDNFCKENNITDLISKYLAQNNCCFIIGNVLGVVISINITLNFVNVFPVICLLSGLNLYTMHLSNKNIRLLDFNLQRAYYVADEFLRSGSVLGPDEVNLMEKIGFNRLKFLKFCKGDLEKVLKKEKDNEYLKKIIDAFKEKKFMAYVEHYYSFFRRRVVYTVHIFLRIDAQNEDILSALLFSIRIYSNLNKLEGKVNKTIIFESVQKTLDEFGGVNSKKLTEKLKAKGWKLDFWKLEEKYTRYHILCK